MSLFLTAPARSGRSIYAGLVLGLGFGARRVGRPENFGLVGLAPGATKPGPPGTTGTPGPN